MMWQVNYFLRNLEENNLGIIAEHLEDVFVSVKHKSIPPEVVAILAEYEIDIDTVEKYYQKNSELAFICGYRKQCIWHNEALEYLEQHSIGWGNSGTLITALTRDEVRIASHKDYVFATRLLHQTKSLIRHVERHYHCVFTITNKAGKKYKLAMALEYEPTADAVRTLWDKFGPFDVCWNINPNGSPTSKAIKAGEQLGCDVVKWEELKDILASK